MKKSSRSISFYRGKLVILLPGMGAVATTFIAGCMLARRGLGKPVGSLHRPFSTVRAIRPDLSIISSIKGSISHA